MDNQLRTVMGLDGMHMERELESLRWDITTGEMSTIIGAPVDGMRMVTRPDGSCITEQQFGNMRYSPDRGLVTIL